MNKIKDFIYNKYYFMQFFLICTILYTVIFINEFGFYLNLIVLAWSAFLLQDRLCNRLYIFKKPYFLFLIAFLLVYAISILLNIQTNLFTNIKLYLVTVIQFALIFLIDETNIKTAVKKLLCLNKTFIIMSMLISSIGMLLWLFNIHIQYGEITTGFVDGILRGVSSNPNTGGMLAAASVILTLINVYYDKKYRLFYAINIIIEVIFVYLSASRGAQLSLVFFLLCYLIIIGKEKIRKHLKLIIICAIVIIALIVGGIVYLSYGNVEVHNETLAKITQYGFFNGRLKFWDAGLKAFYHYPIFGVSPANIEEVVVRYTFLTEIPAIKGGGLHSIVMTTLCATGISGILVMLTFFMYNIHQFIKYLKLNGFKDMMPFLFVSVVLALFLNNLVENNILFTSSYMAYIFWLYLGYFIYIIHLKIKN